jgi:hypothetical protein
MNLLNRKIKNLLIAAVTFGVNENASTIVNDYLEYNEFGLAFEHVVYELYENNIMITEEFYKEVVDIGILMKINESEYHYIKELIR